MESAPSTSSSEEFFDAKASFEVFGLECLGLRV